MAGSGSTDAVWGEHEVDYILVATKDVTYDLNPNEVSDARYVSLEELDAMLEDDGKCRRLSGRHPFVN
jgi:isopentenyldiphosphate isomerase